MRLRPFRALDAKEIITWTSELEEFYKWSAGILGDFYVFEKRLLEAVSGREDNTKYFPLTAFESKFGSLRCRELRPNGFNPDDPPHLCEGLTCKAIEFDYGYIKNNEIK